MPKFDIIDLDSGGIIIPSPSEIIDRLGFESNFESHYQRKSIFNKKKCTKIHKHKVYVGLTMFFYDYKEQIDFFQDDEVIYTAPSLLQCYLKRDLIIREIKLSKLAD